MPLPPPALSLYVSSLIIVPHLCLSSYQPCPHTPPKLEWYPAIPHPRSLCPPYSAPLSHLPFASCSHSHSQSEPNPNPNPKTRCVFFCFPLLSCFHPNLYATIRNTSISIHSGATSFSSSPSFWRSLLMTFICKKKKNFVFHFIIYWLHSFSFARCAFLSLFRRHSLILSLCHYLFSFHLWDLLVSFGFIVTDFPSLLSRFVWSMCPFLLFSFPRVSVSLYVYLIIIYASNWVPILN